jgi:phage FluMu protein Com
MAMRKTEMEDHRAKYYVALDRVQSMLKQKLYVEAVKHAVTSWDYVDGMMQYERKYSVKEFFTIESIEIVLKFAPLVFDRQSLNKLEALLTGQRRIEKNTSADLAEKLTAARTLMSTAYRIWSYLEKSPDCREDALDAVLGKQPGASNKVVKAWAEMELVHRIPDNRSHRIVLATRLSETIRGKCSSCGVVARATKVKFLKEVECPNCKSTSTFVILLNKSAKE